LEVIPARRGKDDTKHSPAVSHKYPIHVCFLWVWSREEPSLALASSARTRWVGFFSSSEKDAGGGGEEVKRSCWTWSISFEEDIVEVLRGIVEVKEEERAELWRGMREGENETFDPLMNEDVFPWCWLRS